MSVGSVYSSLGARLALASLAAAIVAGCTSSRAPGPEIVERRLIIKLAPGSDPAAAVARVNAFERVERPLVESLGIYSIRLKEGVSVAAAQAELARSPAPGI